MSSGLTEEQRRRMEENRKQALLKRAQRQNLNKPGGPSSAAQSVRTFPGTAISSNARPPPSSSSSSSFKATSQLSTSAIGSRSNGPQVVSRYPGVAASSSSTGLQSSSASSATSFQSLSASRVPTSVGSVTGSVQTSSRTNSAPQAGRLWRPECLSKPNNASTSSVTLAGTKDSHPVAQQQAKIQNDSTGRIQQNNSQQQKAYGASGQKTLTQFYGLKTTGKDAGSNAVTSGETQSTFGSRAQQFRGSNVQTRTAATSAAPRPGGEFPSSSPSLTGQCILISRSRFMVDIGYHAKLIEIFKSISSKSYDMSTKKWSFSLANYDELMEASKVLKNEVEIKPLPASVLLSFRSQRQGNFTRPDVPEVDLDWVDEKLVQSLMPFQRIGVNFAIHHGGRALIADEMGLGKTIQALCVACYYRREWPVLVVTPSSVRFSWSEAFLKWIPSIEEHEINVVISGKDTATWGLINIISYDLLARQSKALQAKRFRVIIMDESHFLKNYKTARTKAALPLLRVATRVILLSGTPALSRPSELFQQINAVNSRLFPSFHDFAIRYCNAKQNHFGWDYSGSSNLAELQLLLEEKVMVRRLKKDVLKQLPSKMRQVVMMDPGIVKTGSKSLQCAAKDMQKKSKSEQHGALLKYFSETGAAKIPALREYIVDMAESGHKFLVFAHHQSVLDAMSEALAKQKIKYIRIDGSTTSHQRNELVEKFQTNDSYQVAVLSITACNAGITLTAASSVVFAELFWNPGILVQAEDRVHRIGQQDSVTVRYLIAKGTADDYIWPLVQKKLSTLSKAGLSGDDFQAADTTEMKDPRQRSILSYFEQSFFEDDELSQEDLNMLDAAEAAVYSDPAYTDPGSEHDSSAETEPCSNKAQECPSNTKQRAKGGLFSSFVNSETTKSHTKQFVRSSSRDGPAIKKPRVT